MSTTTTTAPVTLNTEAADTMHAAIVTGVRDFLKARRDLIRAVKAAQSSDLYKVRGFKTWADYATATVAEALPKSASKQEREWIAALLVHAGASTRAAAEATGTSQATVSRRASGAVGAEVAAEVAEVTGNPEDGKKATATTGKDGKVRARKESAPKSEESAPKKRESRTPKALAEDAAAVIVAQWPNLTEGDRMMIADMILSLPAQMD